MPEQADTPPNGLEKKIIILKEPLIESIISDLVTFGCLIGAMWANYTYCGNSKIMSGLFILSIFVKALSSPKRKALTVDEAFEKIKAMKSKANFT